MIYARSFERGSSSRPIGKREEGVATLTMVMVLFFVMAMVAAYSNRNLLYEQRMSINNFRATAAVGAADAGIDWAIAMLSGARVDTNCTAPAAPAAADVDFRSRYTILKADGSYDVPHYGGAANNLYRTSCVMTAAGWDCKCPTAAVPEPGLTYPAQSAPIFSVAISPGSGPGLLQIDSRGSHEASKAMSFDTFGNYSRVAVTLGLVRALPVPPLAAVTAGNQISIIGGSTDFVVSNGDPSTGVTLHAGDQFLRDGAPVVIPSDPHVRLIGPPGSAADTALVVDGEMRQTATALPVTSASVTMDFFQAMFGMDRTTYKRQPSAVFIDCTVECTSASIATAVTNNPGRIIWIEGKINLSDAGTLGSVSQPLMLVATDKVTVSAQVNINGFVYSDTEIDWQAGAAGAVVRGAMVARDKFQASGAFVASYDADMLHLINMGYGSFVRVPGTWQLIPTR